MEVVLTERFSFQVDSGPVAGRRRCKRVICKDGVDRSITLCTSTRTLSPKFVTRSLRDADARSIESGRMECGWPRRDFDMWRPGRKANARPSRRAPSRRPIGRSNRKSPTGSSRASPFFGKTDRQPARAADEIPGSSSHHLRPGHEPAGYHRPRSSPQRWRRHGVRHASRFCNVKETELAESAFVELEANGNAKLEGRILQRPRRRRSRLTSRKKLYTLRATGNRQATIWRQSTLNGEPSEASAKIWKFIPSTNLPQSRPVHRHPKYAVTVA